MTGPEDNRTGKGDGFGGAAAVSPWTAARRASCPRCGKDSLFAGYLTVKRRCAVCGLDFAAADSGDGPAVFVIFIVGFIVTFAALWTEIRYEPPVWVHLALWVPAIIAGTLILLRPLKALMIALQYRHDAREGRAGPDDGDD